MKEIVLNHPLVTHKLSILRNEKTGTKEFREIISEISVLLCYEATKKAVLEECEINTPLEKYKTYKLNEDNYAFVPILRAGMSMVDGILTVIPNAKIGHIGLYRNEKTFEPVEYYYKMPKDIKNREVFVLDPMLATGGRVKKIKFLCIISSPEGIKALKKAHKDVQIYTSCVDRCLNKNKYILPGLGDAGDRAYGTK